MYLHLLISATLRLVLQVESDRLLEVNLDGAALVLSFERIEYLHINLWAIKGSITMIIGPGHCKLFQSLPEGLFSLIPLFVGTKSVLRPSRQLKLEGKSKDAVDVLQEVERADDLLPDLVRSAEDVRIVLLEASYAD